MFKLPKSVVLEGRRYPTWVLSQHARDQIVNLHQVDTHIAELNERLTYLAYAREVCQQHLREALSSSAVTGNCYWQIVNKEYPELQDKAIARSSLRFVPGAERYRAGDTLILYVKGCGVVGWGDVVLDEYSTQRYLQWRCRVSSFQEAIPPKALSDFGLRHPTRSTQRIVEKEKVEDLLNCLSALSDKHIENAG